MAQHIIAPELTREVLAKALDAAPTPRGDDLEQAQLQADVTRALQELTDHPPPPELLWTPEDPTIALVQSYMASVAATKTELPLDRDLMSRDVTYDDGDWAGWFGSLFQWWRKLRPTKFLEPVAGEFDSISNSAQIAMFGDWGSGRYGAPVIASTIKQMKTPLEAVIHLGDTYYAGTPDELESNVLSIWPHRSDADGYLMNGNHERYGGDVGYYQAIDKLEQSFSYFALKNDYFLMVALDSAYQDCALAGRQMDWLKLLLDSAGDRKVILLSHHQPFSAFEGRAETMVTQLTPYLNARKIHAWYWGHEHRCVLYQPHPAWGLSGRCIGHGGYPYYQVQTQNGWTAFNGANQSSWYRFAEHNGAPAGQILGDPNPYVVSKPHSIHTDYGAQGFAMLHLDGAKCMESYRRPDGEIILEQELPL